jgi:uncharacterized membrane protein
MRARERAALRLAVGEVAMRKYLRHELEDLRVLLADLLPENPSTEPVRTGDGAQRRARKSG